MDLVRSCYSTDVQFFRDDPTTVKVRWFFVGPNAAVFPKHHLFSSMNWSAEKAYWEGPGEVWGAERPWVNGSPPPFDGTVAPGFSGQRFAGPLTVFQEGTEFPGRPLGGLSDGTCCACATADAWTFSATNGPTWLVIGPNDVRVDFETSANCGGTNAQIQSAAACKYFSVAVPSFLRITATGLNERQNEGFDTLRIFVDDVQVMFIDSTEEMLGCLMGARASSVSLPLSPGIAHRVEINATTVDDLYHVGMFFEVSISVN